MEDATVNNRFSFVSRFFKYTLWLVSTLISSYFAFDIVPIVTELFFIVKQSTRRTNEGNNGVIFVAVVEDLRNNCTLIALLFDYL
jgi:hypothetical protein